METKEKKLKTIPIDAELHKKAKIKAAEQEKTIKEYVENLIENDTSK